MGNHGCDLHTLLKRCAAAVAAVGHRDRTGNAHPTYAVIARPVEVEGLLQESANIRRERTKRGLPLTANTCLEVLIFQESLPLLWAEGSDLADGGSRWLPYELVHADYSLPQPAASGLFAQSTSGLGAGATRSAPCGIRIR